MELLIAKLPWGVFNILLDQNKNIIEVQSNDVEETDIGTIYVGRVEQVKKNINSAFIRVSDGRKVFMSLQETHPIYYTKRMGKKSALVQGDEILVQIEKEAHKTKLAKATSAITLSGRYAVLITDKKNLFVSSKMDDATRLKCKSKLRSYVTEDYGFIIRTNAQYVPLELVKEELALLSKEFEAMMDHLIYKKAYQILHAPQAKYLSMIRDLSAEEDLVITVCEESISREVHDYCEEHGIEHEINFVKDTTTEALINTYSIKEKLAKLFVAKVWLKSGATIVIEPTEAMTVIDVNTEKTLSRKTSEETIVKTNMEAATMIMKHMRARNMSGIIIIDFIDMKEDNHKEALMSYLDDLCSHASLKTTLHGMTTLGLVEVTRKKLEKPIWENDLIRKFLE